jgi:hypothetical protein
MLPWLLVISLFMSFTSGSRGGFEIIYSGHAPSVQYYSDQLENIYFVDGHKIIKIETSTGAVMEYGSLSAGVISSVDVSNPLQLLVFYRDFNQILFLNNKLARLHSPVNLTNLGVEQAVLVSSSGSGGIWVFSDRDNRLVYFDQHFRNSNQSRNIGSITGSNIKPVYMIEAQNQLYLHVPGKGILVFDRFASWLTTVPYEGPERFQVLGGRIVYFLDGELFSMDIKTHEKVGQNLPPGFKIDNAQLQPPGNLYIISDKKIILFRYL